MNETKQMIKDIFFELMFHMVSLVSLVVLIVTWDIISDFLGIVLIVLALAPSTYRLCVYDKIRLKSPKYVGPDLFEHKFISEETLVNQIREKARLYGYCYEKELDTFYDEKFILLSKDNPNEVRFVEQKIGIYRAKSYIAESYINRMYEEENLDDILDSRKKLAEIRPQYRQMYRLVCGKWGRKYFLPKEWVPMEMILIVIIDEWNASTQLLLDTADQLPFVLFSVINVNEPDIIYIAKDNRKEKKDDYIKLRQELFNILRIPGLPIKEEDWYKTLYKSNHEA